MNYKDHYELELFVYRRPNLRSYSVEMEAFMGINILRNCFDEMKVDPTKENVFLSFPERWLNILEQRALFGRIAFYYPNMKKVTIKTHSVYFVQCADSKDCRLVDDVSGIFEKEDDFVSKMYKEGDMLGDIFQEGKLNVI